jgi:general secretion pathway protein K
MNSSGQWIVGSRQCFVRNRASVGYGLPIDPGTLYKADNSLSTVHCPLSTRRLSTEAGVVLIALLWILIALSVIALSFSRESFVEVAAARNAQSLENAYFLARAGITATIYQLLQKRLTPQVQRLEIQDVTDPIDLGRVTGTYGGGAYRIDIQDESGKINVNTVSEEQLRALVEAAGIEKDRADMITDSILDWRDADSMHRLNGAENDYYEALNPAYKAKNGLIEATEEMLLIRGITAEYFYGRPERAPDGTVIYKYGLSRYLTVYSRRNQVNINFAPLPVLLSVPGMPPQAAQAIYEKRHVKPFKTLEEITRELPVNLGTMTLPYLAVDQTGIYTLTASAQMEGSKVRRVIRTVINLLERSDKTQYRTLYWNENVSDYEGTTP